MFDPYVKVEDLQEAIVKMDIPGGVDESAFYKVIGEVLSILYKLTFIRW